VWVAGAAANAAGVVADAIRAAVRAVRALGIGGEDGLRRDDCENSILVLLDRS